MADQQPIRLVREDGETIDLLAHRIEFVVDRTSSAWTTPFTDSFRAGIDLNMASIEMEVEGTFVDNKGQEKSEFATATMDFGASLPFDEPEGNGQPSNIMPPSNSRNNFNAAFADFAGIAPIVPTIPPTTEEKSRDAYFAGIHNKYFDMPVGYWYKTGEPVGSRHIRFVFDTKRSGSVQEPYAYVNKDKRATNLVIDSFSLFSRTIYVSQGSGLKTLVHRLQRSPSPTEAGYSMGRCEASQATPSSCTIQSPSSLLVATFTSTKAQTSHISPLRRLLFLSLSSPSSTCLTRSLPLSQMVRLAQSATPLLRLS